MLRAFGVILFVGVRPLIQLYGDWTSDAYKVYLELGLGLVFSQKLPLLISFVLPFSLLVRRHSLRNLFFWPGWFGGKEVYYSLLSVPKHKLHVLAVYGGPVGELEGLQKALKS